MKAMGGLSGWLCLSALLSGLKTGAALDSISKCKLSLSASAKSESVVLAAEAIADASAYVCGGGTNAQASARAVAEVTATAAAEAVARATADCYSQGNANFKLSGRSLAQAHAYAYAQAFAAGMVDAAVCNKCKVSAEFVAESWSEIYLKAVAEAELDLQGSGNAAINADIFVQSVAQATVTAYAEVLVDAKAAFDKGCDGSILGVVITGTPEDPNGAICQVTVSGRDEGFAKSAVAEAAVTISNVMCGKSGRVDDIAKAFAIAVAKAIAEVTVDCEVSGSAYACALGDADIRSVAKATASAIAKLVVDINLLDTKCGCEITADAILQATETIVAEAAAQAWAGVCPLLGGTFFQQNLQVDIEAKIATAFAGIWAKIIDGCDVELEIEAGVKVCKSCASNNRRCYYGPGKDVQGCCTPGWDCYKLNNNSGFCKQAHDLPSFYSGATAVCT